MNERISDNGAVPDIGRYRENAVHGTLDFPMKIYENNFSWYVNNIIEWHWHPEIEIAVVLSGRVVCHINDMVIEAEAGEGFLINSNVMHMELPAEGEDPRMITAVFMPEFVGDCGEELIYKRYVRPIVSDQSLQGFILSEEIPWQRQILDSVRMLYSLSRSREWGYELRSRNIVGEIWYAIAVNLDIVRSEPQTAPPGSGQQRIKTMLSYIHENYSSDITVGDIAAAANISKSECFRCFRSTIRKKPVTYLNEYRLKKAAELITGTDMQITQICFSCGFNHISYFGKMFRQYYGMTPKEFRTHADITL